MSSDKADRTIMRKVNAEDRERESALDILGNLLAVIHRDGGQHTTEVGIEQSAKDAHAVWAEIQQQRE